MLSQDFFKLNTPIAKTSAMGAICILPQAIANVAISSP
jgi:hypothetical protein